MSSTRRRFLQRIAGAGGAALTLHPSSSAASRLAVDPDQYGVLVDTTLCVGCRTCEKACNEINTSLPRMSPSYFNDDSLLKQHRRMDHTAYTVVNRYPNPDAPGSPVYAKFQCMHCLYPACVSACIVGAFTRETSGAVIYDAWKCIGCRYCMAACPFQVPAYEYGNALTPQVRKCTLCFDTRITRGEIPACVQSCPMQVMTFGKRNELISLAREKIQTDPNRYIPHIYGEKEVGGTAWMYLSSVPFETIDLPRLGYHPAPGFTEPIQHAIFKYFIPPVALYSLLGTIMWFLRTRKKENKKR